MPYLEHERMYAIMQNAELCGIFLNWLQTKFVLIDKSEPIELPFESSYINVEEILAEFFDIDLEKIAEEKDQMVQNCINNS